MTLDEMDKKIEFILEMQAQFEANVGKLATNLARSEANIDHLRVSVADLAGVVRESVKLSDDRFTRLDERLTNLAEAQRAADERSARFDERMIELATAQKATEEHLGELAGAQKATEERLDALINVLERHITGPDHAARP